MQLNLADLALRSGERYERIYLVEFHPIVLGGEEYRVLAPDGVHATVDRVTGGYLVTVDLDAKIYGPCARCLSEAVLGVHAEQQEFAPTAKDGWQETDESEFIQDLVLDVEGLAREALVLALPAQVVCKQDCKGLCAICGKDLNKGPCSCSEQQADERWGRLKDLKWSEGGRESDQASANSRPEGSEKGTAS